MRITFLLNPPNTSGGVRHVAEYADRLQRRGHVVTVVARPGRQPSLRDMARSIVRRRPWPRRWKLEPNHLDDRGLDVRLIDRYRPILDRDVPDADVVVATWWETAPMVAALAASKGAKAYQVMDFGANPGQPLEKVVESWRLPMYKMAVSQWLKNLVFEKTAQTDVGLISPGVDHELFEVPPRQRSKIPTIGFVYSREHFKGADLAIAACDLARRRLSDLRAVAIGSHEPSAELPLPNYVDYRRKIPDSRLKEAYSACDAWLFCSRMEGFGLPPLEAMCCRTPAICVPAGAGPELIADGAGILVPHDDPQRMADAILTICTQPPEQWRAMSDKSHAVAMSRGWEQSTDAFEAGLRRAIELSRRSA